MGWPDRVLLHLVEWLITGVVFACYGVRYNRKKSPLWRAKTQVKPLNASEQAGWEMIQKRCGPWLRSGDGLDQRDGCRFRTVWNCLPLVSISSKSDPVTNLVFCARIRDRPSLVQSNLPGKRIRRTSSRNTVANGWGQLPTGGTPREASKKGRKEWGFDAGLCRGIRNPRRNRSTMSPTKSRSGTGEEKEGGE